VSVLPEAVDLVGALDQQQTPVSQPHGRLMEVIGRLLYRHGHKTTIEMDLLLKQMRVTGRLATGRHAPGQAGR
jgi:hypothetical protein